MIWLLLILTIPDGSNQAGIVGNGVASYHPCRGYENVSASIEVGLPPGEENQYSLIVAGEIVQNSQIKLKFDSDATIVLFDPTKARITAYPDRNFFNVRFFRSASYLNMRVKGPATGTIPYVQSVVLNGDEICKRPQTGYFDQYIQGIKDTAEISLTIPQYVPDVKETTEISLPIPQPIPDFKETTDLSIPVRLDRPTCGRRKVVHTELIVNGQSTEPGDWPWHVAIFRFEGSSQRYICGGTLLSKTLVLTAAHCVTLRGNTVITDSVSVSLGKHNLIGGDIAPQERQIFQIIVHPEFDVKTVNNDIALLKLRTEAVFDDYVQPACLWHKNNRKKLPTNDEVFGTVVGWGFNHQDVLSTTLQQITIPLVSDDACLKSNVVFYYEKLQHNNKFCAGYTNVNNKYLYILYRILPLSSTMIWLLLMLTIPDESNQVGIVGNPLAFYHPCEGNDNITASFESGLPPGEENQLNLNIIGENIVPNSQINLKFDSDATIVLSDPMKARVSAVPEKNIFNVRFFKKSPKLNVQVKGPATGTIPYVQSIVLNDDEICQKPQTGYFDLYIQGVKDTAEISLTIPTGESCGRRKVVHTELIVNGQPTKPGDWPWHVAIFRVEGSFVKYICGGTLLSKTLILTAAHCVTIRGNTVIPNSVSVILGKHNLIGGDVAPQEREIFEIIVHSAFDVKTLNNDIALLILKSEAVFDDYVQPACVWHTNNYKKLPSSNEVFGTVVGWGFDHQDVLSTTLQQITIPLVSEATCLKSNPIFYSQRLNNNKFCAGYTNGTSACNGDSGGGLVIFVPDTPGATSKASGAWYVRGIVSSTVSRTDAPICDPYQYTLFTDVVKYREWVLGYLK